MTLKALVEERPGPDDLYPTGYRIVEARDEEATFKVKPPLSWKKCPDGVDRTWSYDGKKFHPPEQPNAN